MPDDRLIHARCLHSQKVASLGHLEFRVWMTYELAADDFGVMRQSAVTLQDRNDALLTEPLEILDAALERLVAIGLLGSFTHQGRPYVFQRDWQTWQSVRHPRHTNQPKPPPESLATCDVATRKLFRLHPGKSKKFNKKEAAIISAEVPNDSRSRSETLQPRARACAKRLTANGKRLTANGEEGSAAHETTRPEAFVEAWNTDTQPPIPRCRELTPARRRKVQLRLRDRPLEAWRGVFQRIQGSAFCRGETGRGDWRASFDWVVANADNAVKVLEGKYDDGPTRDPPLTAKELAEAQRVRSQGYQGRCPHEPACGDAASCVQEIAYYRRQTQGAA